MSLERKTLYYDLKNDSIYSEIPEEFSQAKFIYPITIPKPFSDISDYPTYDSAYKNVPWYVAFEGRRRCARWLETPIEIIKYYFSWIGVDAKPFCQLLTYPISYVLPLFKKIKIYCHTHYDLFGSAARYFVDLDALSGIPPPAIRSMGDDPYAWLTKFVRSEYDRTFWSRKFEETFCHFAIKSPAYFLSLRDFAIRRWLWVTHGSTRFSKLELDGEVIKTKFGAAVSLSDSEILKCVRDALRGKRDQQIQVFVKPDEASFKRRLIANVPLGGYIIAAYIRWLLEQYLGKEPQFEKLNTTLLDQVNVIQLLRQRRVALPLDESAYDYHVTRDSWLGFFDFLKNTFPQNEGVIAFKQYFDTANWIFEDKQGKWMKGMPSGLALTTLVNSWMNYIKQTTIVRGDLHWACGDDVLVFPWNQDITLKDIEVEYLRFGSEANAAKNWSSTKFAEYLKVLYGRFGTSGYPARIYGSLMFTSEPAPVAPNEKLYEIADLWKLFFDRCGLPMDEQVVARDLAAAISHKVDGFNKKTALLWLHSPKIHGGYGKLPYNNKTFTWILENKYVSKYTMSRYRLPPVVTYSGKTSLTIGSYKLTSSAFIFGPPAVLPPINTEEEWVARLNREDIPDRGPFTGLVLETIPLPVVDFISVSSMSKFASANLFNCFPNLKGSWNSIASKLINGSLLMFESISSFMRSFKINFLV